MNDMKPYFRGIEMYNEALMVKVVYPNRWKAYPSNDGRIKVTPSDTDPNLTYYYADSKDTTYEDMFDLIEETIKANNDIVLKLKLLKEKGEDADFETVKAEIEKRDWQDMHRDLNPLCKADDAIEIDSSIMNIEETVSAMLEIIRNKYQN